MSVMPILGIISQIGSCYKLVKKIAYMYYTNTTLTNLRYILKWPSYQNSTVIRFKGIFYSN